MMSIIELYQILREVTLTKAKILEEVIDKKHSIGLKHCQTEAQENEKQQNHPPYHASIDVNFNANGESEQILMAQLSILRRQESEVRELKNKKMEERIRMIGKGKQLQIILEQMKHEQITRCLSPQKQQRMVDRHVMGQEGYCNKLWEDYTSIKQQVQCKQQQSNVLQSQIQAQQTQVTHTYEAYQTLEESINEQKQRISAIKKQLQQHEFEYERAWVQNRKLMKEIMRADNHIQNIRGLQKKVSEMAEAHKKVKKNYSSALANKQKYLGKIADIKRTLQI